MVPMLNEMKLLWEAERYLEEIDPPSHERLASLVGRKGIDVATAALYLRVRARHTHFISSVDDASLDRGRLPSLPGELWVVPAAGYRERPEYGGDGSVIKSIAEDFGLKTETLQTQSLGSIQDNAALLRARLAARPARSVLLATLSKGAAELKVALGAEGAHREAIYAWLNVGGLPEGTPLLDWGRRHPRTWLVVRLMMLLRRIEGAFVDGLSHKSPLLQGPTLLPADIPVISVVGFPLRCHLDGTIAERHGHLAPMGPNDGYGLLLDAMIERPGGHDRVYPVWGASHYLRTPGLSRVFYGILTQIASVLR